MKDKTGTRVVIAGKEITLSGYESQEYLQGIADYINHKHDEFVNNYGMNKLPQDMRNILMQINIADDLFKALKEVKKKEDELTQKDNELYDIKHELVTLQMRLEDMQKTNDKLSGENGKIRNKKS